MTNGRHPTVDPEDVTLRRVTSLAEYQACHHLEAETWGQEFGDLVPASILMICQKIGGLVAGAFDPDDRMLGFVFGLDGHMEGERIQWSHMLAVRPEARGLGIGRRLKLFQREQALAAGIQSIYWTYDPLVARNAHLNLNRLGVHVVKYLENVYGSGTGSRLHGAAETDRFLVRWKLRSRRAEWATSSEMDAGVSPAMRDTPVVNPDIAPDGYLDPYEDFPEEATVRVEVPEGLAELIEHSPGTLGSWRRTTRQAFEWYLQRGYEVRTFFRETSTGRCFYVLSR